LDDLRWACDEGLEVMWKRRIDPKIIQDSCRRL
jgi:hypothetical protein